MALHVSAASPAEWPAAGRVLFAAGDAGAATARFLELIAAGEIDPGGVFVARDRGRLCGAMLVQPFAGAQGSAWPPAVPDGPGREQVEDALTMAALGWLRAGGAKVAQSLLRSGEPAVPALLRAGFARVTELAFLTIDRAAADPTTPGADAPGSPLIEPYSSSNAATFADVLMASYDGTLDCPELNGTRTADEVVAGYRHASPGGTREWFLASLGSEPVGVLMLTGQPAGAWVLTYVGVVPAARGQGIGRALTRLAIGRVAAAGATRLTLNVDVRNKPARRLYADEGFAEYDRREVYLAVWHRGGSG